jgi:hypothetical protein
LDNSRKIHRQKKKGALRKGLEHERFWKRKEEEYRWLIPVAEYDKANEELRSGTNGSLVRRIEPGNLYAVVVSYNRFVH